MIKILIVEDHAIYRQGIIDALSEPDFQVVGAACDGETALELIAVHQPDITLLDIHMPIITGMEVMSIHNSRQYPYETKFIVLTGYDNESQAFFSYASGAFAYLAKECSLETLRSAIRHVANGGYVLREKLVDSKAMQKYFEQAALSISRINAKSDFDDDELAMLSPREMTVLNKVSLGLSTKEIALQLGISSQTVKNHMTATLRKIGVSDRTQAAVYAWQQGWVYLDNQHFPGITVPKG